MKRLILAVALITGCAESPSDPAAEGTDTAEVRTPKRLESDPNAPKVAAPVRAEAPVAKLEAAPKAFDGAASLGASVEPLAKVPVVEGAEGAEGAETPDGATAAPPADPAAQLLPLLQARHTRDLPTKQQLAGIAGAKAGLESLAGHESQLVAARALTLLGHYPDAQTRLIDTAENTDIPRKLRAAALQGLAYGDIAGNDELRLRIETLLRDVDIPVAFQAASVLGPVPASRPVLVAASKDTTLPSQVQMAARRALGN